jgi:alpha-beta hydrolase superfamily lysophospholipase
MQTTRESELEGARGRVVVHEWQSDGEPRFVALISHGYGEHARRYDHLAAALVAEGGAVYAPDHLGHGRSDGERALIENGEDLSSDLHRVTEHVRAKHPGLPLVLIGHSMGGLIATRYVQRYDGAVDVLVLSAPAIGGAPQLEMLLGLDQMPEIPIDPAVLSRDLAVGQAYADDPLVWHGGFRRATLQSLVSAVRAVGDGPSLGALPTLYIHGEADALVPREVTRPAIEHVRGEEFEERVYPGARHEVFNETNKDEVIGDVIGFIKRRLG